MDMIEKLKETLDLIDLESGKLKITTNESKIKISATLLVVSIDHARGIYSLLEKGNYPPAFALIRVLFETYIRGKWVGRCANEQQVEHFVKKDEILPPPGQKLYFGQMVEEVEKTCNLPSFLSKFKQQTWSSMNSFTHGGVLQAQSNFNGKSVVSCYAEKQINRVVLSTNMLACFAFSGLLDLANPSNGQQVIEKIQEKISPWAFSGWQD